MTLPLPGTPPEPDGHAGETYGAVLVRASDADRAAVIDALRAIRFSGWVAAPDDGWLPVIGEPGDGTVAAGRRGVLEVAAALAERFATTAFAVRVRADRQLVLAAWTSGTELGRYSSDPSRDPGADDEVLAEPHGAEHADAFAIAVGRPEAAEKLAELLGEELDPDSVFESERLAGVLDLLGMPRWIVAAAALPRDIPTGPRARDLVRLGAGSPGAVGRLRGRAAAMARRRMPPPPAIADPPRAGDLGIDPWLL
ncbi:hypothetical protein ACFPER_10305 [Agromyces aurantiacus]|uniref:Uncharacterized protein n=1 Tax=Agromyces aurantiacus TaxID=165814 RepID=A0ABV9R6S2_9MICO|nr:hypothetical protein [Agromyces aurantiacus]MBM7503869.1 hypothetical protein [Agromyces aurantiacus]